MTKLLTEEDFCALGPTEWRRPRWGYRKLSFRWANEDLDLVTDGDFAILQFLAAELSQWCVWT